MKYVKRLTVIQLSRLDQSSKIYQKHLTTSGMKVCFINSGLWVSQESFITFLKTIFQVDSTELLYTDRIRRGNKFYLVSHRVQYWPTSFSYLN